MMYRLIRWILHKFNYELVHFAEMEFLNNAVNERAAIAMGKFELEFIVSCDGMSCDVVTKGDSPVWINIKKFYIEDYGSEEYARACAQELCDKLNEEP
jgi:hypothetical protein